MANRKRLGVVVAILICLISAQVRAEATSPLAVSFDPLYLANGATGASVAADTTFRLRLFGIYSTTSGSFDIGPDRAGNTHIIDLEDTLGMDTDTFTGGVLLGWNLGSDKRWHIELSYDGFYDHDGDKVVGSIIFDDVEFTAEVESELEIHSGAINIGYDFWRSDVLTLTGNLGLRIFKIDASIEEVLGSGDRSVTLWLPVPTPGATLRWDITPNIYVKGTANGIYLGDLGCYAEVAAEVGYDFNANLGVFMGYRHWYLRADYEDDAIDFDNGAVYAGIELRM